MSISFPEQLVKCRLCWRITFAVFALIFIVESVLLIPSAQRFKQVEIERLATRTQSTVDAALMLGLGLSGGGPLARDLATLVGDGKLDGHLSGLVVTAVNGKELARAGRIPQTVAPSSSAMPTMGGPSVTSLPADMLSISWLSPGRGDLMVTAFVDAGYLGQELRHYLLRIGGLILVIVFVVTGGTMIVLYRALLRPILQLRESAIAAGQAPKDAVKSILPEVSRRKPDELGDLVEAHNRLLSRVSESMQREAEQAEEREYFLARHDAITGLPNRVALMEFLENAARQNLSSQTSMALFLIQLSVLNERSEDCLLATHLPAKVNQQWEWLEEKYAFVAQLGPQSIVVVRHIKAAPAQALDSPLASINSQASPDSASIAEHILRAGSVHAPLCEMRIGIVESASVEISPTLLLSHAEFALNRVRADPATRYQFFDQASADEASARQRITRELARALIDHELVVWFQPKVSLQSTTRLTGMEALVRWQHPTRGVLSPAEFVPLAEATGQIEALDRYVFAAACAQMRAWRDQGFVLPRVAINLAARTFESPRLADDLRLAIETACISPRDIEIEITETAAMKNVTQTAATLSAIRALGMHTAIDDFGTGYSSLSYLRSFQIDTLKIDRSFVNDIGRNPNVEAICGVIAQLGRAIGAHVVAEGVETDAEATYLRTQGCHDAQGYLFGHPLSADEFAARWLVAPNNIDDENFISARAA